MRVGSLLGHSKAVLDGLGPSNPLKPKMCFRVLGNAIFRYFEALDGPLGQILAPRAQILGPIWPPKVA